MTSYEIFYSHDDINIQSEAVEIIRMTRNRKVGGLIMRFVNLLIRFGEMDRDGQAELEAELDYLYALAVKEKEAGEMDSLRLH